MRGAALRRGTTLKTPLPSDSTRIRLVNVNAGRAGKICGLAARRLRRVHFGLADLWKSGSSA
jgi:hypothetical protein